MKKHKIIYIISIFLLIAFLAAIIIFSIFFILQTKQTPATNEVSPTSTDTKNTSEDETKFFEIDYCLSQPSYVYYSEAMFSSHADGNYFAICITQGKIYFNVTSVFRNTEINSLHKIYNTDFDTLEKIVKIIKENKLKPKSNFELNWGAFGSCNFSETIYFQTNDQKFNGRRITNACGAEVEGQKLYSETELEGDFDAVIKQVTKLIPDLEKAKEIVYVY